MLITDRQIVEPTVEPVTVAELKAHARITNDEEDVKLAGYITAAREHIEGLTGRALATQSRETSLDWFPCFSVIRFGRAPLISVESVKYLDGDGVEQTLAASEYVVDVRSEPGELQLALNASWPKTANLRNCVRISYTCGYASTPAVLKQAVLFLAAHWYEQGLPVNVGNIVNQIPHTLDAILWANRVF